jgi:hypothetical protein
MGWCAQALLVLLSVREDKLAFWLARVLSKFCARPSLVNLENIASNLFAIRASSLENLDLVEVELNFVQ